MKILDLYSFDTLEKEITEDFNLIKYEEDIYIGIDSNMNVCVVTESNIERQPVKLQTKALSLECNVNVDFADIDYFRSSRANIIKCLLPDEDDKEIFLELATMMVRSSEKRESDFIDTFKKLSKFFEKSDDMSEPEMIGLYAELYTIVKYENDIKLSYDWQSKDRMKFDFSFSDEYKLEIKATTKSLRTHHFRHEQLVSNVYNIYVLSYMLRRDDCGLSLYELLNKTKELLINQSDKLYRIEKILRDNDVEKLKNMKFNKIFTEEKMHFYKADDIPKFNELTPNGVTNAEYDCVLENVPIYDTNDFINDIKIIKEQSNDDE